MSFLGVDGRWRMNRLKLRMAVFMVVLSLLMKSLSLCSSLNSEGLALLRFRDRVVRDPSGALSDWKDNDGVVDPCSWSGVECADGKVVILSLKDLCLEGTLAPELGNLAYIRSIILRNNSFSGNIPKEIGELRELEVLDLGYNNFSGPFPSDFGNNLSLTTLLLDNNKLLGTMSPELHELTTLSEFQVDEDQLTGIPLRSSCNSRSFTWKTAKFGNEAHRRLLQAVGVSSPSSDDEDTKRVSTPSPFSQSPSPLQSLPSPPSLSPSLSPFSPLLAPSDSPLSPSPSSMSPLSPSPVFSPESPSLFPAPSASPFLAPAPAPTVFVGRPRVVYPPIESNQEPNPSTPPAPSNAANNTSKTKHKRVLLWAGIGGGCLFVLISLIGIIICRSSKVVTVKPWATGLSGQLQKAFVSGVPKLNRPELEAACEDFSNIIGTFSDGTVYKGTLSSGVEIAVTSTEVTCSENWSKTKEAEFRKKIETLSKLNHKNFVNLLGYCEEEVPFTRMMVFEYAPNGTLFEHLHIKEAEHLDWETRLRIAMGVAYCLEYMHISSPPIALKNLQSSSIFLTEDFAAKISDFSFWNDLCAADKESSVMELLEIPSAEPVSNVYSFGVILFEMMTGRIPYSVDNCSLDDWASHYLKGDRPLREMVDPTLTSFQVDELEKLFEVIHNCVRPDPEQRPTIREIIAKLKDITAMEPEGAAPKLSPLWWAELEIMSADSS